MKQRTKKINNWKFGVLSSLCLSLFLIFACSEEKAAIIGPAPHNDNAEVQREIFNKVEEQPTYKGGMDAFYKYVTNEMRYPDQAKKSATEGTVQVQFVIERDGSISNLNALNSIGSGCEQEARRVIAKAPDFIPGSQRGRTVRVAMIMPITFKLNQDKKKADSIAKGIIIPGKAVSFNGKLMVKAVYNKGNWSGTVISPGGDKLPGANIVLAGTKYGTVSDLDGTFSIKADEDQEIHISYVGYKSAIFKQK